MISRESPNRSILERLSRASENDLRTANYRSGLVIGYLHEAISSDDYRRASSHLLPLGWPVSGSRSELWKWISGLAAGHGAKGNRTPKLPEASLRGMTEAFEQDYETKKQKTLYASWIKLKLSCEKKG
jgi:hypothetical protein